jgi:hypothetical protein
MSLILSGTEGISGSAGVIDAETFAGQANTYYTDISARLGYTPLSNVNPSYSGTLTGNTGIINIGSGQVYKDSSGNVGIGTSSPTGRLDVLGSNATASDWGNVNITSRNVINSANRIYTGLRLQDSGSSDAGAIGYSYNGTGYNMMFATVASVGGALQERMRITSDGKLGLGSTSPVSSVEITTSTPIITLTPSTYSGNYRTTLGTRSGAEGFLIFGNNNQNEIRAGRTAVGGYLDFYTNNTVGQESASDGVFTMRMATNGNVGIGVIPTTKLDVSGNVKVSGSLSVAGIFNNLSAANRRQVWSHVGLFIANGASADIIRNRGGYSRAIVEVYAQSQHGSNGYFYRMYQLSRYGLDNMVVASSGTMDHVTISLNGNSGTNDNAIRFSVSGSPIGGVTFPLFVAVSYFGSETGIEFDSPAGLTRIS